MAKRYVSDLANTAEGYAEYTAMNAEAWELAGGKHAAYEDYLAAFALLCETHDVINADSPAAEREARRERRFESRHASRKTTR